jgi:basic amino acid/polyamine antiporter, APA family
MTASRKTSLSLFDITMIVVGLVIGLGIFRTASDSARAALTPAVFFLSWMVGGFIALCGALTYAEIGSRYPITGGYYKIYATCYHPSIAFAINCIILISNAASVAGVALIGSEYIAEAVFSSTPTDLVKALIAMGAIVLFYGINLLGLRMSSTTQNILMLIKIAMLLLILAALFFPSAVVPVAHKGPDMASFTMMDYIKSFGVALVAVSFTYGGYQQTINFGGEVQQPQKNLPRGIFIGIVLIILLYLLVSFAYYKVIGFEELKTSKGIAAIVAERMFGPAGSFAFSILLFIAVLAYVNVLLLSNPRVMYAMSEDGILPKVFGRKDKKRGVLTVSLSVFSLVCVVVLFFADTFDKILGFTIFLDSIGMAFSAATIFIIRKRTKHLKREEVFSMKLFPLIPIVFILSYIFIAISIAIDKPDTALTAIGVLLAFLGVYFLTAKKRKPIQDQPEYT